MRKNIIISDRGQITLPSSLRKRLGFKPGSVVIVEDRQGEIVLKPAAVMEIEMYSDADISRWDEEDRLGPDEKESILKRIAS